MQVHVYVQVQKTTSGILKCSSSPHIKQSISLAETHQGWVVHKSQGCLNWPPQHYGDTASLVLFPHMGSRDCIQITALASNFTDQVVSLPHLALIHQLCNLGARHPALSCLGFLNNTIKPALLICCKGLRLGTQCLTLRKGIKEGADTAPCRARWIQKSLRTLQPGMATLAIHFINTLFFYFLVYSI